MLTADLITQEIISLEQVLANFKGVLQANQTILTTANLYQVSFDEATKLKSNIEQYKSKRSQVSHSLGSDPEAFKKWDNQNYRRVLDSVNAALARLSKTNEQTLANAKGNQETKAQIELKSEIDKIYARLDTVEKEILSFQKKVSDAKTDMDVNSPSLYSELYHSFDQLQSMSQNIKTQMQRMKKDIATNQIRVEKLPIFRMSLDQMKSAVTSLEECFAAMKPARNRSLEQVINDAEKLKKFKHSKPNEGEILDAIQDELDLLVKQTGLPLDKVLELSAEAYREGQRTGQDGTALFSQYAIALARGRSGASTATLGSEQPKKSTKP